MAVPSLKGVPQPENKQTCRHTAQQQVKAWADAPPPTPKERVPLPRPPPRATYTFGRLSVSSGRGKEQRLLAQERLQPGILYGVQETAHLTKKQTHNRT